VQRQARSHVLRGRSPRRLPLRLPCGRRKEFAKASRSADWSHPVWSKIKTVGKTGVIPSRRGLAACRQLRFLGRSMELSLPKTLFGNHSALYPHYTWFKFPVLAYKFPVPSQKFTVPLSREFCCKPLNLRACQLSKSHEANVFDKIPGIMAQTPEHSTLI